MDTSTILIVEMVLRMHAYVKAYKIVLFKFL